jgi:hypothetical protein
MGDIVFDCATAFGEVTRAEVVPRFIEDLKGAISVRSLVTDLNRLVADRMKKIRDAEPEDLQWCAQQVEKDLDLFGRTPGYRALRAQDKRGVVEFRHAIGKLALRPNPTKAELIELVEPFEQLIGSFTRMNARDMLVDHDRQTWANVGVKLEQIDPLLRTDRAAASKAFGDAVTLAQGLYGRDPALDVFLRKARKTAVTTLPPDQLEPELNKFRELLASLSVY